LIAFVPNGAILPRLSGASDLPLKGPNVVQFQSPPSLEKSFKLKYKGVVSGMGIPRGVTLIAGGGFHGKSTLLEALQSGVYNHIPGDGREYLATDENTVKVRAEDGRYVMTYFVFAFFIMLKPS
jgi:predicted ABC-class ATPase